MSAEIAYALVDNGSNGKKVIARKDFLPGEIVICEKEPLFSFSRSFLEIFKNPTEMPYHNASCEATFHLFMNVMIQDQKERLMSLYVPVIGNDAQLRKYAQQTVRLHGRRLTSAEIDLYVKVACIVKMNLESVDTKVFLIFEILSRVRHSCLPNCHKQITSDGSYARAIKPIKSGEEVTMSYTTYRDLYPTHKRRLKYLETKGFTCHCPRCDAPGDDTRQFDCFDPACKGVMMVCQPINKGPVPLDMQYTGVEYVEPHLLPCTVCHRPAPSNYEFNMFLTENLIETATLTCEMRLKLLERHHNAGFFAPLLEEMQSYVFPKRHLLTVPFLGHLMRLLCMKSRAFIAAGATVNGASFWLHRTREVALQYIAGQEGALPWPHDTTYEVLEQVCQACIVTWEHSAPLLIFPEEQAQQLLKKTIRMKLVRKGRDDRDLKLEAALAKILQLLPSESALSPAIHSMEVCAFCEESPAHASMKRSRCDACKKVMYCSAGCQKAHWKLHKKTCGV